MERGEVHGRCGSIVSSVTSTRPDWFPQKKIVVPFQIALERSPEFPDVPALGELAKDTRTKQVLELVVSHMAMDKPFVMPPGVPEDRVAVMRKAFQEAVSDPRLSRWRSGNESDRSGDGGTRAPSAGPRLRDAFGCGSRPPTKR